MLLSLLFANSCDFTKASISDHRLPKIVEMAAEVEVEVTVMAADQVEPSLAFQMTMNQWNTKMMSTPSLKTFYVMT